MGILDELDAARDLLGSRRASSTANTNEAFRRAVIALERRVEELAREAGAKAKADFSANLNYLRQKGIVTGEHLRRLDRIRETRNCVFHSELDVPPMLAAEMISEIESFVRATSADISGLMTRKLFTVDIDAPLEQAEELIYREGVSHLPVTDGGRVVGVVSSLGIIRSHRHGDAARLTVAGSMEPPLPEVAPDAGLDVVLDLLEEHPAMLVASGGVPLGILTRWDLVQRYWHSSPREE